jgi:DNA topoisomerase IA
LTAQWELGLERIEQGKLTPDRFREEVCKMVSQTVTTLKQAEALQVADPQAIGQCPLCK